MSTIEIKGILNADGKIQIELPDGWQSGEITVEIQVESDWSDEEISESLSFRGKTLGDIDPQLLGAGADWDIDDSAEWVKQQRNKRRTKWTD